MDTEEVISDLESQEEGSENVDHLTVREYGEMQFDKQIVFLSSGALGLSIAFLKNLQNANEFWPIIVGWIAFATSLCLMLFTHRCSVWSSDCQIKRNWYDPKKEKELKDHKKHHTWHKRFRLLTYIGNEAALGAFICGTIFFVIFLTKNLGAMPEKEPLATKPNTSTEKLGRTTAPSKPVNPSTVAPAPNPGNTNKSTPQK